ncbi:unnamed protein product [Rotaria socialis]|uniref:Uncharacterized protein n=1 Tax=Rotaria socialis TaxID=392032 RepID=A0A820YTJ7_9BILA|nr:unnamed protein product [Rotaria socialis]CAF3413067.1 unnamed protein product [Rotaria socialis]CAF3428211.1 unnamed protein product [Rotaria socialis]CAF3541390.1 unnamed protein product [Rotaria socialis]CAF3587330.1 unnamed protein product [Rotaria socialis]
MSLIIPPITNRLLLCLVFSTVVLFSFYGLTLNSIKNDHYPMESYTRCLVSVHQALDSLAIPWFLTFGSALMYWRSNNFLSNDMDIGIFYRDLKARNFNDKIFVSTMKEKFNFTLRNHYGEMNHGKEWSFACPKSNVPIDVFVFYPFMESKTKSSAYWSATYNGLCNKMKYKKCRWKFRKFNLVSFEMLNKTFSIVPIEFIVERYGENYRKPKQYGYFESLNILPNLIEEYDVNITNSKQ